MDPITIFGLAKTKATAIGLAVAFLSGLIIGEVHGRDMIKLKWLEEVVETEEAAVKVETKAADVEEAQEERVSVAKKEQRAEDVVSRQTYNKLERKLSDERSNFEKELAKARSDKGDGVNCALVDMPIGLQRRPIQWSASPDHKDESNLAGAYPGRPTGNDTLPGSGRD